MSTNIKNRIIKLEEKTQGSEGGYLFYLLDSTESIRDGRIRVGIPAHARDVVAVSGGLPRDPCDPPYYYFEDASPL